MRLEGTESRGIELGLGTLEQRRDLPLEMVGGRCITAAPLQRAGSDERLRAGSAVEVGVRSLEQRPGLRDLAPGKMPLGVGLGVERVTASIDLDADRVLLQPAAATRQRFVHDEAEELLQAVRCGERLAAYDSRDLRLRGSGGRRASSSRLCDFSIRCFEEPLALPTHAAATLPRSYISCVREGYPARVVFERFARRAPAEDWWYDELPTGHDCHVETPDRFCALLTDAHAAVPRP